MPLSHRACENYGPPMGLLSDSRTQFAAKLFTHVCELVRTTKLYNTLYHAQATSQVERYNLMLLNPLRHYALDHPSHCYPVSY